MITPAIRNPYHEAMITAMSYPDGSRERMLGLWWANEVHRAQFPGIKTPMERHGVSHRFEEIVAGVTFEDGAFRVLTGAAL